MPHNPDREYKIDELPECGRTSAFSGMRELIEHDDVEKLKAMPHELIKQKIEMYDEFLRATSIADQVSRMLDDQQEMARIIADIEREREKVDKELLFYLGCVIAGLLGVGALLWFLPAI